jgi:hypothetical protein
MIHSKDLWAIGPFSVALVAARVNQSYRLAVQRAICGSVIFTGMAAMRVAHQQALICSTVHIQRKASQKGCPVLFSTKVFLKLQKGYA